MDSSCPEYDGRSLRCCSRGLAALALLIPLLGGCAALTNPIVDGVPARRLPPELRERPREQERTIPLTLLGQNEPDVYRIAPGDVLGIYIEGVLGERGVPPPVNIAPPLQIREQRRLPPAFGYPIPVREDGTLGLPLIDPLRVTGMSLKEAQDALREMYIKKEILIRGRERIVVTLLHPRQVHVVVMRQEASNVSISPDGGLGGSKRGTGHTVDLSAYENDVLHALSQTGGLPGLDAYNAVVIFRGCFRDSHDRSGIVQDLETHRPGGAWTPSGGCKEVIHIPLRLLPGEALPFKQEDVILQTGDVVFLEARDREVFYTGGLLPPGEFILPRDYDLDVVEAISRVRGSLVNGAFGGSNLSGTLIAPGVGNPSPSLLTVLRRLPAGGQLPIRIDLNKALKDPRQRVLVQPGDVLILQEMPSEALTRYFSETFFNFSGAFRVIHGKNASGVIDISAPERIPGRIGVTSGLGN